MDEEVNPDHENVNSVLAQDSIELFHILSSQSHSVIMELCQMMPSEAWRQYQLDPSSSSAAGRPELIKTMLDYFRSASARKCRNFLQSVCFSCENIPMLLESRLMSVAGYDNTDDVPSPAAEDVSLANTDGCESSRPAVTSLEQRLIKRPRIDHWEQYISEVKKFLLKRWERLTAGLVREVQLENVWVSPRAANRSRDRPDQTPGSADRGGRTPEPDGDYGYLESRVTLETFLQGCMGKVTVLVGQTGSGKTLLTSCLGQQWASGLGPIPSSFVFVLLEFRQLNLLSHPLSLSELLFQYYLPPTGGEDAKRAIIDYLLTNPEQSCWVLDGYDEFHGKLSRQEGQRKPLHLEDPLPVADLISGLLNRQILPGSTVLVTCRVRDLIDLDGISDQVGQLLGWDQDEIKEYVDNFFGAKADVALREQAAQLLLSSRHLLAMSSIPALCNICCICLEHLLLQCRDKDTGGAPMPDEEGSKARTDAQEAEGAQMSREARGEEGNRRGNPAQRKQEDGKRKGSKDVIMDGTNGRPQLTPTSLQVPATLTQVYLTVLASFLSRAPNHGGDGKPKTKRFPHSAVTTLTILSQYQSELCELSQLAWRGLEESKILFLKEEIPQEVLKFSLKIGLLSQVELRRQDGILANAYCFIHLTVQEFLAALRIMTSHDVNDAQLKKRFSLKTRWTTKSDQKTVFTDSLYLYVCGLASSECTPALVELAKVSGRAQSWVQKRQDLVLTLLKTMCNSNTLTGPKILQLCHSVQESQSHQLAKQVFGVRPKLELRNIWLLPNDIEALAFVVNSADHNDIGLDFGACSMELECLIVLARCQGIHNLSFHSRKYGDKFAEKLSSVLPKFTSLRKLEFSGASLTATGAASLASGLQECPHITDINVSDNNLRDEGISRIAEIFTKLQNLSNVALGRNSTTLNAVDCLIKTMSSCLNIQRVHAEGIKDLTVTFFQKSDMNSHKSILESTISLLNQNWNKSEMQKLAESLARCPALSVLDLSGGQWDEDILRTLTEFLPKFSITDKLIINDSCSSVEGLVVLTALLSDYPPVMELHVRLQVPVKVSIVFARGREKPARGTPKSLCLSFCNLYPADLESVLRCLGTSSDLTMLDLSSNCLGNKGLKKLLDFLPRLSKIQEINASKNDINMEGVVMLAAALCSYNTLTEIHISGGGKEEVSLKFCPDESDDKQQLKMFRVKDSSILPSDITKVCRKLVQSRFHWELELSQCSLTDKAIKNLLKVLPEMTSLQRLNVRQSITSATDALELVSCSNHSQRVTSVELSPQGDSFINFDTVKVEQLSCRLTHFCLKGDHLKKLLEILQQGPQLSDLDLSSNQLEDEDVSSFVHSLPRLKISTYVNLSNNRLTQQGLLAVASTLCTCANVSGVEVSLGEEERCLIWFRQNETREKTLRIREGSLKHEHLIRLAEIVSSCPHLAKVELNHSLLEQTEHFLQLLSFSQSGCVFSIEERWISAEKAVGLMLHCLQLNSNIQTVRIHQNTLHLTSSTGLTTDSDLSGNAAQSSAIKKIGLVDCAVNVYQLAAIESVILSCPFLTELEFSHNSLGVEGAEFLCSVFPRLPNLTSLSLSGHQISETAAQNMTRFLPCLRSLNLSHCVLPGGLQLIEALGQCVILEDLCLDFVALNEESRMCLARALKHINSIRRLRLNEIVTAMDNLSVLDLLAATKGHAHLEQIELGGWRMACRGIEELNRLIPNWKELRKIKLSKNLISDQSGEKLLEALKACSHLEELCLSDNKLGILTAARMALIFPSLTHLSVLDISLNHIDHEGSNSLSKAIMCMKNLKKINLTSVGTSKLRPVVASLAHCPLIQEVGLGWNNCRDEVALEVARVLPFCHTLTQIDLECNSLSASGAEALLKALRFCPALQLVRLWKNKISDGDVHRLGLRDRRMNFSST
ncbi:NLR family, CARD domain containing 5 isoform X1 [Haplochromis burtoni]|uniref:NLR family, CARD domain containing 5 isoform X1 n=1 Tax=Haplochromis burtoni TaxID=8153 RepID=UPI0003BCA027|nr:NLR family, CARD domain containing 5 isoform X1 [Haplochromis burtoni]XP_042081830.1 NLR family, CARD domain containing 5 isoform X1 [Haplochromis burtoni]XP_042081831.1 NLR family, CARD domain containing 5 isoform X1 [Haplochromis burtoni]